MEVLEDHLLLPGEYLLPLSARGSGVPSMTARPWSRLTSDVFYSNLPVLYSLALRREAPDMLRGSLRARRTFFEGFMLVLAEKTGRQPSLVECSTDHAMDAAKSELTSARQRSRSPCCRRSSWSGSATKKPSGRRSKPICAHGLTSQRLFYIAKRAIHHFQPGEKLFPSLDEPPLLLEEAIFLLSAL